MRRLLIIVISMIAIGMFAFGASGVEAQSGTTYTWDFTEQSYSETFTEMATTGGGYLAPVWIDGMGWRISNYSAGYFTWISAPDFAGVGNTFDITYREMHVYHDYGAMTGINGVFGYLPSCFCWQNHTPTSSALIANQTDLEISWTNEYGWGGTTYIQSVEITIAAAPVASFVAEPIFGQAPLEVTFTDTSTGAIDSWEWNFGDGESSEEEDPSHTYDAPGIYTVELEVCNSEGCDTDTETVEVIGLFRPLAENDVNDAFHGDGLWSEYADQGLFEYSITSQQYFPDLHTVIANSRSAGDEVYAVTGGTVTSVEKLANADDCPGIVYYVAMGCMFWYVELDVSPAKYYIFTISLENLWRVEVSRGDNTITYYVADAPEYVYEGLVLGAGCIVGTTVASNAVQLNILSSAGIQALFDGGASIEPDYNTLYLGGITFIEQTDEDGDQENIIDELVEYPEPSNACNADPEFASCRFDPQFQHRSEWEERGTIEWGDRILLHPGSALTYRQMPLSDTTAYTFRVYAGIEPGYNAGTYGPANLKLSLGDESATFRLDKPVDGYSIELDGSQMPNDGMYYSLSIQNVSSSRILTIYSNCLSAGTPPTAPGQCYFQNYSFDENLTGWTTTGSVYEGNVPGEVLMQDGGQVGQNVLLLPDSGGDHNYSLYALFNFFSPDGDPSDPMPTLNFEYQIDGGSWEYFGDEVTFTSSYPYTISMRAEQDVIVSAEQSGVFNFRVTIDDGDYEGFLYVALRELCIDDDFDGYENSGGAGGIGGTPIGPDAEMCKAPPRPNTISASNAGDWINYLWLQLRNYYYCTLQKSVNDIRTTTRQINDFVVWQFEYWQHMPNYFSAYAKTSVIPWIEGHLANIANGRTVVIQDEGGCHDLFCLLDGLISGFLVRLLEFFQPLLDAFAGYLEEIIDLLFRTLNAAFDIVMMIVVPLVQLVISFIRLIITLADFIRIYLQALGTAINNAQPTIINGLPNCNADPQSSSFCMVVWGMDNTIFSDEGALIVPLLIAILAILQLQTLGERVTNIIEKIGNII